MAPKITLYTSHLCPWAHRSQIALRELGLEFDTVIIDLSVPRTPEYLAVNPRGLVPSLSYDGTILTESGLISQFLLDSHPSHLVKTSSEPGGALQRFQLGFFVDTYFTKAHPNLQTAITSLGEEKNAAATKYTDAIIKEVEPLLSDAAPFFGGSSRLTLAEVCETPLTLSRNLNFVQLLILLLACRYKPHPLSFVHSHLPNTKNYFQSPSKQPSKQRLPTSGSGHRQLVPRKVSPQYGTRMLS
jgi:glutathione S-transferase